AMDDAAADGVDAVSAALGEDLFGGSGGRVALDVIGQAGREDSRGRGGQLDQAVLQGRAAGGEDEDAHRRLLRDRAASASLVIWRPAAPRVHHSRTWSELAVKSGLLGPAAAELLVGGGRRLAGTYQVIDVDPQHPRVAEDDGDERQVQPRRQQSD